MGLVANGTDVGMYETNETASEFYDYQETATHQAQGLEEAGVTNQGNTHASYIYLHHDTANDLYDLGLHHYTESDSTQLQAQVPFGNYHEIVRASSYLFVENVVVDIGEHGETSFVYQSDNPVRNNGGGSFVYESGTTLTPESVRTLVQDDPEDETDDSYLVNEDGDPVSKHLYDARRGDGAVYGVAKEKTSTITFTVTELDDGRDDGQPLPDQWVARGPNGTETKATGAGFDVEVSTL